MKQTKKGFTLVELLVVIAILAILTTVSVVGYTSFIEKANRSVDEQAVAQMNTALIAGNIPDGQFRSIHDVIAFLNTCDLAIDDYKPLSKDKYFFWDCEINRIIYTDSNYTVLAPAGIETDSANWISLIGQVEGLKGTEETTFVNGIKASVEGSTPVIEVGSLKEVYTLSQNWEGLVNKTENKSKNITIKFTDDINFMGASIAFNASNLDNLTITADSEVVLSNIAQTDVSIQGTGNLAGELRDYFGGLVPDAGNIVIKNITLENCSFGREHIGTIGAFVGRLRGTASFENCYVVDSHLIARNKVAPFIGNASDNGNKTITFVDCGMTGTTLYAREGAACQIIGRVHNDFDNSAANIAAILAEVELSNNTVEFGGPLSGDNVKYEQSRQAGVLWTHSNDYTPVK